MIITPEHYIDIMHVKEYNARQTAWHMKFFTETHHTPRVKGWVVCVENKNGVGTRQRFCQSKLEAIYFVQLEYGVEHVEI